MLLALLLACPPSEDTAPTSSFAPLPDGADLSFTCAGDADEYSESDPAFTETTDAWGLGGFTASNMLTVDLDGDGYADLLVNEASGETRDDPASGVYAHRVLMNRASGG